MIRTTEDYRFAHLKQANAKPTIAGADQACASDVAPASILEGILYRIQNANQWLSENIVGLDTTANRIGLYSAPQDSSGTGERIRNDGLIDNIEVALDVLDRNIGSLAELRSRLGRLA